MEKVLKNMFIIILLLLTTVYFIFELILPLAIKEDIAVIEAIDYFQGSGTEEAPYLITSTEELEKLGELVNTGKEFRGIYFEQIVDLDLGSDTFIPIGQFHSNQYFYGIYDGAGHTIRNLNIEGHKMEHSNVALFGQLGGTVKNLGIESGLIQGFCIGSIASHSVGNEAKIINCYNKATLKASGRAGGIVDNFSRGQIINCWNEGAMEAPETGGISSYNASMIYNSYCVQENMVNPYFKGTITLLSGYYNQSMDEIPQKMDMGIPVAIQEFGLKEDSLLFWDMEGESISFKKNEE